MRSAGTAPRPVRNSGSQLGVPSSAAKSFQGTGTVVAALPRAGRLIVNHDEIQGFMAAMEMSYAVTPPFLLNRLNAGDKIRFTLDAAKSAATPMDVINSAKKGRPFRNRRIHPQGDR